MFTIKFCFIALFITVAAASGHVIYVDKDSTYPLPDGTSWQKAYPSLQAALLQAGSGDQVWVAKGVYTPDPSIRLVSFELESGVSLYGGFAGTESTLNERVINVHLTVLSGDLFGDDSNPNGEAENSLHVVKAGSGVSDATIDGFIIKAGNANIAQEDEGAGMLLQGASDVTVKNCTFKDNYGHSGAGLALNDGAIGTIMNCSIIKNDAKYKGGGMAVISSGITVVDCTISNNTTENEEGGGAWIAGGYSGSTFSYCEFSGNKAKEGGGALCVTGGTHVKLIGSTFLNNEAAGGGALMIDGISISDRSEIINCSFLGNFGDLMGGAVIIKDTTGPNTPLVVNCEFSGNVSWQHGGAVCLGYDTTVTFTSSTFSENTAGSGLGGGICAIGSSCWVEVSNSIFWGNEDMWGHGEDTQIFTGGGILDINYSCVQGWSGFWAGTGNFGDDPLLKNADGRDNDAGTWDDDLSLEYHSPCRNTGDNSALPPDDHDLDGDGNLGEPIPYDVGGRVRIFGKYTDIGANEWTRIKMKPLSVGP